MARAAMQEMRLSCRWCLLEIEDRADPCMGGPLPPRWVHVYGGSMLCYPQQAAESPRAEPLP